LRTEKAPLRGEKMRRFGLVLLVPIVLVLSMGISWGEIYKWVDENGVLHFSDTLPPETSETTWEDEEGYLHFSGAPPEEPSEPVEEETPVTDDLIPQEPLEQNPVSQDAKVDFEVLDTLMESNTPSPKHLQPKVELYVTSWCGYCKKATSYFRSRGIVFAEYDVEKDQNAARRMMELTSSRGVPFAVINGQRIHGYNEAAYEEALKH
jgi:glutaredoxin-like YruB-family protein